MIVDADFVNHWKTRALMNSIGRAEALQALLLLWGHCQNRKAWEFQLNPTMLAGICCFDGDEMKLWDVMQRLRFIEPAEEEGWLQVHEWGIKNASLVGSWKGGAQKSGWIYHPRGYAYDPKKEGAPPQAPPPELPLAIPQGLPPGQPPGQAAPSPDKKREDGIGEDESRAEESKPASAALSLSIPAEFSDRRAGILRGWLDYREKIGKPLMEASWQALLLELQNLNDDQLQACVTQCVTKGWIHLRPAEHLSPPTGTSGDTAKNREKKEGPRIPPADFPWRELARDQLGDELIGTWEEQTARTRQNLRDVWRDLSGFARDSILAAAEKKEGAADV